MRKYGQLNEQERYEIAGQRSAKKKPKEIAEELGRHVSTIYRELARNRSKYDGKYRASRAQEKTNGRRSRSRRNSRIGEKELDRVEELLREEQWSPEQISGWLKEREKMKISHERIYQHVWANHRKGGDLRQHLRGSRKQRRKRYSSRDSRGRLPGKRAITERPAGAQNRNRIGHWEIDTVLGTGKDCILTLVERKSGYVYIGKLSARTSEQAERATMACMERNPGRIRTITADNGTKFHGYGRIEAQSSVKFYFAAPHHSWERGTNENTNGLIRQYLLKRQSMKELTQIQCDEIAMKLNRRPRKRLNYKTPHEIFSKS